MVYIQLQHIQEQTAVSHNIFVIRSLGLVGQHLSDADSLALEPAASDRYIRKPIR